MSHDFDTCSLCPRLCRPSCPVAVGGAREAAVPAVIAEVLRAWSEGRVDDDLARAAATLCVDCGACQHHCHLDTPLPAALREARAQLLAPPPAPEVPAIVVEGEGDWVCAETDDRRWAEALASAADRPTARWRVPEPLDGDRDGEDPARPHLQSALGGRTVIVASGGVAKRLVAAGITVRWLHEVVPTLAASSATSCACTESPAAPACCGGAGPLAEHHPDTARRVAAWWHAHAAGQHAVDSRCSRHLASAGLSRRDAVDRLLDGGH